MPFASLCHQYDRFRNLTQTRVYDQREAKNWQLGDSRKIISKVVISMIRTADVYIAQAAGKQEYPDVVQCPSEVGKQAGKEIAGQLHILGMFHLLGFSMWMIPCDAVTRDGQITFQALLSTKKKRPMSLQVKVLQAVVT